MLLRSLATCLALSTPALAADVWVDAIHGDDNNGGSSASDAWKSLTHALTQLGPTAGSDQDVVHVLPGLYDPANGESFPLDLRNRVWLRGEGPRELIQIRGQVRVGALPGATSWHTGLENLTISDVAASALRLESPSAGDPVRRVTARRVTFRDSNKALWAIVRGAAAAGSGVRLEECLIRDCVQALRLAAREGARLEFTLRDSSVRGDSYTAVYGLASSGGLLNASFERSRFEINDQTSYGLRWIEQDTESRVFFSMRDSALISPCLSTYGCQLIGADALFERCTLAGHDQALTVREGSTVAVHDTLFGDNYLDLWLHAQSSVQVHNSIINHSDFTGFDGNEALVPSFVDPFEADYRMTFASPGVDRLPPMAGTDYYGQARDLDGDLDSVGLRDVGAFETATLEGPASLPLGVPAELLVQGPAGELARLYVSRLPLQSSIQDAFGASWLSPGTWVDLGTTQLPASQQVHVQVGTPSHPALAGVTLGYQALIGSAAAPAGQAWSAPAWLRLE